MTIVEFLQRRYDEIESTAQAALKDPYGTDCWFDSSNGHIADHYQRHEPENVLADIASKRRLIDLAFRHEQRIDGEWGCCHEAEEIKAGECDSTDIDTIELLRVLALPFASHPNYRPEWKLH